MFHKKTVSLLALLAVVSGLAWIGSPVLAKATSNAQAVASAPPPARHIALLKGPAGEVSFPVLDLSHLIISPRDSASGRPSGKRDHKPFTIIKTVDQFSALLLEALIKGEPVSVEVTSFRRAGGRWVPVVTVQLDTAFVGAIGPRNGEDRPTEEVAFYYNKIAFNYAQTGATLEDFWTGEYP